MDTELINIFNEVIDNKYNKTKHKTYYSNEYYLTNIFEMLNDINKWETLKKLKTYNPVIINNKIASTHYSTIRKKFNKWSNDGIFESAFSKCINLTKKNLDIKLSIDSSFINNKYGIEDIALNIDNKKKKASKISLITDSSKFIYSILSIKINKSEIKKKTNSCLTIMAIMPRTEPIPRLPTSPINILAGFKLKVKKAKIEPIKAMQKNIISPENKTCGTLNFEANSRVDEA